MRERLLEDMPEIWQKKMFENMSEETLIDMSERMLEEISEDCQKRMSDMPEKMSTEMSEKTKNVGRYVRKGFQKRMLEMSEIRKNVRSGVRRPERMPKKPAGTPGAKRLEASRRLEISSY